MSGSDEPKFPFQILNQVCLDVPAVEKLFGKNPVSLRRLDGYEAKSHSFGSPIDTSFRESRIGPVELAGFGEDHRETLRLSVHKALHGVLTAAFKEIAACGMSYHLRKNDAGGFLFRYKLAQEVGSHRPGSFGGQGRCRGSRTNRVLFQM
jgi:hypothetical protein